MTGEFTAVIEPRRGGRFHAYVAELPEIKVTAKTLEEARARLAEKLRAVLEERRQRALARAGSGAQVERMRVGRGKASDATARRRSQRQARRTLRDLEREFWQALLDSGRIDRIPERRPRDADDFEPVRIEGRPISEEIIEGRR